MDFGSCCRFFHMQLQQIRHKTPFDQQQPSMLDSNIQTPAMASTMTPTIPGFLNLPLEIRQQISHSLFAQDFQSRTITMTVQQRPNGYELHGLERIQGLVFVSQTFYDELLTYCFARFTFFLRNSSESIRFVVREFYRQIGVKNRKLVKHITIPNFSIDRVLLHPVNMVALFASSQARCLQLLDEMQGVFALLERFPALEELDLGVDSGEALRSGNGRSRCTESNRYIHVHSKARNHSTVQGRREMYDSHIRTALQEAGWLSARVNVGIWWTYQGVLGSSR
jgi:hypothetical protein